MTRKAILLRLFLLSGLTFFTTSHVAHAFQPASGVKNPVADPKAMLVFGDVRFTVLTPSLIRLEWSPDGKFEDRPSLVFINRHLPVPILKTKTEDEWLILETEALKLRYKKGSGKFSSENLEISSKGESKRFLWRPGTKDTANLGGTIRTLDGVKGAVPLDPGLISRDGWVVIDDSKTVLFDGNVKIPSNTRDEWPWVLARPTGDRQDMYFFGYGSRYKEALGDYVNVAGKIPMPPRYAFGAWWSRYWRYTDEEIRQLVKEFQLYEVPLDVYVIDMDWHLTFDLRWGKRKLDQAGQMLGWTGYTWDNVLFPDPPGLLEWLHKNRLQITFNLHPASGIQPHEDAYQQMATAMGIDPSTKKYVPFNIIDKKFSKNYFDITLRSLERQGVDFWWIDWQQWDTTSVVGLNPTWWLNYSFYTDMERQSRQRPIILARWGGLGSHRHQIGFSGDVITDWSSLEFQPYFTSTAANVAFGYWSHDIGGHIPGTVSPELYTRWVQWGAFSPVLRTHTTKNSEAERRIWAYPPEYFQAMREAFRLRYEMLPYIYTASRKAYETGISLCHPLYYEFPDYEEAYVFKTQYLFGHALMIAPVTTPLDSQSVLSQKKIWIPPGTWIEWFTGKVWTGPKVIEQAFALDEIPIYVKAGAIVPQQSKSQWAQVQSLDPLILSIFPLDSGSTSIYEDGGNSLDYTNNEFSTTPARVKIVDQQHVSVEIGPTRGKFNGMINRRGYELRLHGVWPPSNVTADGRALKLSTGETSAGWSYDGNTLMTTIVLEPMDIRKKTTVVVTFSDSLNSSVLFGVPGILRRLNITSAMLNKLWPKDWAPDILIEAAQTGNRITLAVSKNDTHAVRDELLKLQQVLPQLPKVLQSLEGDQQSIGRALNHLRSVIP